MEVTRSSAHALPGILIHRGQPPPDGGQLARSGARLGVDGVPHRQQSSLPNVHTPRVRTDKRRLDSAASRRHSRLHPESSKTAREIDELPARRPPSSQTAFSHVLRKKISKQPLDRGHIQLAAAAQGGLVLIRPVPVSSMANKGGSPLQGSDSNHLVASPEARISCAGAIRQAGKAGHTAEGAESGFRDVLGEPQTEVTVLRMICGDGLRRWSAGPCWECASRHVILWCRGSPERGKHENLGWTGCDRAAVDLAKDRGYCRKYRRAQRCYWAREDSLVPADDGNDGRLGRWETGLSCGITSASPTAGR